VVLVGVDGSGKSTLRSLLYAQYGRDMCVTHGKHAWFDIESARKVVKFRSDSRNSEFESVARAMMTDKHMPSKH
jgi:alpha-D-ribose 1-methylphosphonate 5-triphosphate synthase subunit PhnL